MEKLPSLNTVGHSTYVTSIFQLLNEHETLNQKTRSSKVASSEQQEME